MPWRFRSGVSFLTSDVHQSVSRYTLVSLPRMTSHPVYQTGEAHRFWGSSRLNITCQAMVNVLP